MDSVYVNLIIAGGLMLISLILTQMSKKRFDYHAKLKLKHGMNGSEIARKMLIDHGIYDVKIISTRRFLGNYYNPLDKTLNLSEKVLYNRNALAAAIAAHECGHAVQHAREYKWLELYSKIAPMVNVASGLSIWVIIGGLMLAISTTYFGYTIPFIGFVLYVAGTLLSFFLLPAEYNASHRALVWLKDKNILSPREYIGAENILKWVARKYMIFAIGALASSVYFLIDVFDHRMAT